MAEASEPRFRVLHALRIKGFATTTAVVDVTGLTADEVGSHLTDLAGADLTLFRERGALWQLTGSGRAAHVDALEDDVSRAGVRSGLEDNYDSFLALNVEFKELCRQWQLKPDPGGTLVTNEHNDARYDEEAVAGLVQLDAAATPVCGRFASVLDRFVPYEARLGHAAAKVAAGHHQLFTGVMCGSYHDVWMELHEDLILSLGVDRAREGSF
jgi:hypothetical protein